MKTYQDSIGVNPLEFVRQAINEYKTSDMYKWAVEGDAYVRQQNTAITQYRKMLYRITGEAVEDKWTANHKCASNFYNRFMTQLNQYVLGNGVRFTEEETKERLGDEEFDTALQKLGKKALTQGVAYGFWNLDHMEVFEAMEFVPLVDEETGAIKGGIRFWQIDNSKPLRATYYEMDGYTEYMWDDGEPFVLKEKRPYQIDVRENIDGTEILDFQNYPTFPIVPLYSNAEHQCELIGLKEEIDAYDLIKSGFANDLDDASMIYWVIKNTGGGMDDIDLAQFIERMKILKTVALDGDASAEAHTIDVPYQSRETYLTRLEEDLYKDAMILNTDNLAKGNVTATAIIASYSVQDIKATEYEHCIKEFIRGILTLIGIDDVPLFERQRITNESELTQEVLSSAQFLDTETILRHLPFISTDEIDEILDRNVEEESDRFEVEEDGQSEETDGQEIGADGETDSEPVQASE